MKSNVLIKVFFLLPLIIFIDYILMVLIGCASCLFGFGEDYFCGSYCLMGKIILILSGSFFVFLIYPDLKAFIKKTKNVEATEK